MLPEAVAAEQASPPTSASPREEFPRRVLGPTAINSFYFWGQVLLLLGKLLAFASSSKVGKMFKFNKYAAAHTHTDTRIERYAFTGSSATVRMRDILVQRTQKVPQLKSNFWDFPTEWAERFRYGVDCGLTGVQLTGGGGGCLVCLSVRLSGAAFGSALQLLGQRLFVYLFVCCSRCLSSSIFFCAVPFLLFPLPRPPQLAQLDVCSICLYIFNFGADRRPTHFPRPLSVVRCPSLCISVLLSAPIHKHTHTYKCNLACVSVSVRVFDLFCAFSP